MTTWFITRHPGALEWARAHGIQADHQVDHLDPAAVRPGDLVLGTLPIQLAAAVCERGARYFHLDIALPRELRGRELDAGQMQHLGASLREYLVSACNPMANRDD